MKLSLVIPAYNEENYIGACLKSVMENAGDGFSEIIVVDNGSTDRTGEIAREWPGVQVVLEPHKGLTHARECGRLNATGDLVAYLDADCVFAREWLDTVEELFTRRPDAVSLSGPAIYVDASQWQKAVLNVLWSISAPVMYYLVY